MIRYRIEKVIDVGDWDDLVQKTYGKPYSFQQQEGCQSRRNVYITVPEETEDYENVTVEEVINGDEMGVNFEAWKARDPKEWHGDPKQKYLDLFWERNFYPSLQVVANDLHAKGLLPAGDYVINIDW